MVTGQEEETVHCLGKEENNWGTADSRLSTGQLLTTRYDLVITHQMTVENKQWNGKN